MSDGDGGVVAAGDSGELEACVECGGYVPAGELGAGGVCGDCLGRDDAGVDPFMVELRALEVATSDPVVRSIGVGVLRAQRTLGLL